MCRIKEDLNVIEPTKNEHQLHGVGHAVDATPVVGEKDGRAPTARLLIRSYSNFLTIDSDPCKPARYIPQGMQLARVQEGATLL